MSAADTRHRILDAAEPLFAEHGFAATSAQRPERRADAQRPADPWPAQRGEPPVPRGGTR